MLRYIFRRILVFVPTLFLISVLAFVISAYAPGHPEERAACDWQSTAPTKTLAECEADIQEIRKTLRLDLPLFYFRLASYAEPDTLYQIYQDDTRRAMSRLLYQTGEWQVVGEWHRELNHLKTVCAGLIQETPDLSFAQRKAAGDLFNLSLRLLRSAQEDEMEDLLSRLAAADFPSARLPAAIGRVQARYTAMKQHSGSWKTYVPWPIFYGFNNQYHCWLTDLLHLNFGRSHQAPYQPIARQIGDHFTWSFILTLLSVLLAYLISIPLGLLTAAWRDSLFDRFSAFATLALDSLPSFFTAILLMVIAVYGFGARNVTLGMMPTEDHTIWKFILQHPDRLILPLIAYTYGALAFLSRTLRTSMLETLQQDYIRTARAKGLSEWRIISRHALKNALLPMITIFAAVFPALISGSVILEDIFGIPGMGSATLKAITAKDTPMIVAVFTLTGGLTVVGYLVADLLYTFANPRIRPDL